MDNDALSNAINKVSKCAVKDADPWIIFLPQWCYSNNDKNSESLFNACIFYLFVQYINRRHIPSVNVKLSY